MVVDEGTGPLPVLLDIETCGISSCLKVAMNGCAENIPDFTNIFVLTLLVLVDAEPPCPSIIVERSLLDESVMVIS